MIEPLASPDIVSAILAVIDAQIAEVHVAIPARVLRYDPTTQQVDAQILVKREYPDEFANRQLESSIVSNVPVQFLGSGSYSDTFPIAIGDTGLLVFCHSSIDRILSTDGSIPVDPVLNQHHDVNDAVYLPGWRPFGAPITPPPPDARVITAPTGAEVRIGSAAATGDANSVVIQSALDDFKDALAAAITAMGADPAASALAALQTQLGLLNAHAGWKANTSKAKAE
jgi:hypothetical protein